MPLLIGYIVALALLLGGGYVSLQWLVAPESVTVASAAKPGLKMTAPHPTSPEAIAKADANETPKAADEMPEANGQVEAAAVQPSSEAAANQVEMSTAQPQTSSPDRAAEADIAKSAENGSESPAHDTPSAASVSQPSTAENYPSGNGRSSNPAPVSAGSSTPARRDATDPALKPRSASVKKKRTTRAASHDAPIEMILQTIEYPDGTREQRLLPVRPGRARISTYDVDDDDDWD